MVGSIEGSTRKENRSIQCFILGQKKQGKLGWGICGNMWESKRGMCVEWCCWVGNMWKCWSDLEGVPTEIVRPFQNGIALIEISWSLFLHYCRTPLLDEKHDLVFRKKKLGIALEMQFSYVMLDRNMLLPLILKQKTSQRSLFRVQVGHESWWTEILKTFQLFDGKVCRVFVPSSKLSSFHQTPKIDPQKCQEFLNTFQRLHPRNSTNWYPKWPYLKGIITSKASFWGPPS